MIRTALVFALALAGCGSPRRPPVVAPARLTLEQLSQKHFIAHAATPAEQRRLAMLLDLHGKGDQAALIDGPAHPAHAERTWFAGDRKTPFFAPEAAPAALRAATQALPTDPRAVRTLWLAAHSANLDPSFLAGIARQWRADWPESPEASQAVAMSPPTPVPAAPPETPRYTLRWQAWPSGDGWAASVDAIGFPRGADALYAAFAGIEIQHVTPLPLRGQTGWRARVRFPTPPTLTDYRIIEALGGPQAAFMAPPGATDVRQQAGVIRLHLHVAGVPAVPDMPNAPAQPGEAHAVRIPDLGACTAQSSPAGTRITWRLPARTVAVALLEEHPIKLRALRRCAPTTE